MVELIVNTSTTPQIVNLELVRPYSDIPHQIAVTVTYFPTNALAKGILVRLTNLETTTTLDEITNSDGQVLFELLNLEYGYLNGDRLKVEAVI